MPLRARITRHLPFVVVASSATLITADFAKIGLAVPGIEQYLGADQVDVQIVLSGYLLAFALSLAVAGRLGDLWSHKAMFVIGIAASTAGSVLCALAWSPLVLDIGRLVMGAAAGVVIAQTMSFIQLLYRGRARGHALGIYAAGIGITNATLPLATGALMTLGPPESAWRWIFWINVPPYALAIPATALLPARRRPTARGGFDLVGLALLGLATLGLMLPFVLTSTFGPGGWHWLWLALAAAAGAAFVRWELRATARGLPVVLNMTLLRSPPFRHGIFVGGAYFGAFQAALLMLLLYLQQGLHRTPVAAGLTVMAFTLGSALSSLRSGRLVHTHGTRVVTIGLTGVLVCTGLVAAATALPDRYGIPGLVIPLLVMGVFSGLVIAPNLTLVLRHVPAPQSGVAGALLQLMQRMGATAGVAIAMSIYHLTLAAGAATDGRTQHSLAFRNGMISVGFFVVCALVSSVLAGRGSRREENPVLY